MIDKKYCELRNRLFNWEFEQAKYQAEIADIDEEDRNLIEALSRMFGNVGWNLDGDMHLIIWAAVNTLIDDY